MILRIKRKKWKCCSSARFLCGALRGNESDSLPPSSEYICDGSVRLLINTNEFMTALQKSSRFVVFQTHFLADKIGNQHTSCLSTNQLCSNIQLCSCENISVFEVWCIHYHYKWYLILLWMVSLLTSTDPDVTSLFS